MKNFKVLVLIVFSSSLLMCAKKTDTWFQYQENFISSIDGIDVEELEKDIFKDSLGQIYALAFGGEEYAIFENFETYKNYKGRIIFFSIENVQSSFALLEKEDVNDILNHHSIKRAVKTYNSIEVAYLLSNDNILLMNKSEGVGWMYKNIEEMNLINS